MYEGLPVVLLVGLAFCGATFLWAAWATGRAKVASDAARAAEASAKAAADLAFEAKRTASQAKAWGETLAGTLEALANRVALAGTLEALTRRVAALEEAPRPAPAPPKAPDPSRLPSLLDPEDRIERSGLTEIGVGPPAPGSWQPEAPRPVAARAGR